VAAPQPTGVDTITLSELAEARKVAESLREAKEALQRRVPGLEQRIKDLTKDLELKDLHIAAVEGRLRDESQGNGGRVATLQTECRKLRDEIAELRSQKFGLEEDLKAKEGHIQELEALLEGATHPEAANSVLISKLMPQGEPLDVVKLRDTSGGKREYFQAVFTLPKGNEILKKYGSDYLGKEFGVYMRDGALVFRPMEQVQEFPEDTPEANARARSEGQTVALPTAPEPEPAQPAEEPARPPREDVQAAPATPARKPPIKLPFETFRLWAEGMSGEFTRQDIARAFNVSDPTVKKALQQAMDEGLVIETQPYKSGTLSDGQGGRVPAKYAYVKNRVPADAPKTTPRKEPIQDEVEKQERGKVVAGTGKQFKGSGNPVVRKLIMDAKGAGADVSPTSGGHLAVIWSDNGARKRVLIANTPKNSRTVANDRARLRREGLDV
jgi:hypothetical protein